MDKVSFLMYLDYEEQFNLLTDEQLGQLMRAIIKYEKTKEIPQLDAELKMAFSFIKTQLDRDREKYQAKCEKNRENAKKGGRPKKQMVILEVEKPNGFGENQMEAKKADKEDEEDKDIEEDIKRKSKRKTFTPPTLDEIKIYIAEKKLKVNAQDFYDYFTEGNWIDAKGNAVKSWKQKILTWNNYKAPPKEDKKSNFKERKYNDLNNFYVNMRKGEPKR